MQFTSLPASPHPDVVLRALEPADIPHWFAYLSRREAFERRGFEREGLLRNYRPVRGIPADFWIYARLAGTTVNP